MYVLLDSKIISSFPSVNVNFPLCLLGPMRAETKIQAALAVLGVPLIFYFWKADAKWPNPFALSSGSTKSRDKES